MMKISKKIIYIMIFLALALLLLGSSVSATVTINGQKYYTRDDISWNNRIQIKGEGNFYCINHNYFLTGHLGNKENLTFTVDQQTEPVETTAEVELKKQELLKGTIWDPTVNNEGVRALIIPYGQGVSSISKIDYEPVTDPVKKALYAFAYEFYQNGNEDYKVKSVQHAIWEYINEVIYDGKKYDNYDHNQPVYLAAMAYQNWVNNGKANVKADDSRANCGIINEDYVFGPFKVSFNAQTYGRIKFAEIESYKITDANGNELTNAYITNSSGTKLSKIPNNSDFYVRMPYTQDDVEINIDMTVKQIESVSAEYKEIHTAYQELEFQWTSNIRYGEHISSWKHGINCSLGKKEPNRITVGVTIYEWSKGCSECGYGDKGDNTGNWTYVVPFDLHGEVVPVGDPVEGKYQNMCTFRGKVDYSTEKVHLTIKTPPSKGLIDIEGDVWEDTPQGKNSTINGWKDNNDKELEGIEVRLYNKDTGELVKLTTGTNPTLTDKKGHYAFKDLIPIDEYIVVFAYDGMMYTNTYGAGRPTYNSEAWMKSSKGSELVSDRNALNTKFVSIGSYPLFYKTTPIFSGNYLTNGYNNLVNEDLVKEYKKKITEQLRNYLSTNKRLEDGDSNYINNIYLPIINNESNKTIAKQVLQYIWDCRITATAGCESERDGIISLTTSGKRYYYPYYDKFVIADKDGNRLATDVAGITYNGFPLIYNGQLHVNLGVVRRTSTDLQLEEDLHKTVVSINGHDETYEYSLFDKKGVKINAADALATVTQNVTTADYNYNVSSVNLSTDLNNSAVYSANYAPIQMYITYRINVKNNSSLPTSIDEIATYIDPKYFSYSDTYKTTKGTILNGIEANFGVLNGDDAIVEKSLTEYDLDNFGLKVSLNSKYGSITEKNGEKLQAKAYYDHGEEADASRTVKDLYISFDKNVILGQNETLAVYITYRLGENSTKSDEYNCTYKSTQPGGENHAYAILQDLLSTEDGKVTVCTRSEINGYSTFFKKEYDVSNTKKKYNAYYTYTSPLDLNAEYRPAGVIDALSIPGNLSEEEVKMFESDDPAEATKLEDDWDRASTFVITDDKNKRTISGNVWETVGAPANKWTEQKAYPTYDSSHNAEGITVELLEINNGTEYLRASTKTAEDGSYAFTDFIPGSYIIRFIYGDYASYDTAQFSKYSTFTLNEVPYKCAYNGEFYQSAHANPKTNDKQYWYAEEENVRYSDAYDEANRRKAVNDSLQTYSYKDVVSLLKHPTDYMMYAHTSLLEMEVEKAKTVTNDQNPSYTVSNVDFALTPRTESKLTIDKEVSRIKLILQGGIVKFDADTESIRNQKVPAVVQAKQGYDINIALPSQEVDGATLEITYKITVTNNSGEDSMTFYKDSAGNMLALGLYKEDPTKIVYYEDNGIRVHNNTGSFIRNTDTTWVSKAVAGSTDIKAMDASKTETVETTTRADVVADFISNNLNFSKVNYTQTAINSAWDVYTGTKADFETLYYKQQNEDEEKALKPEVNTELATSEIYDSNVIVLANDKNALIKTDLEREKSVSEEIVLSKVISVSENDKATDKKSYINKVKILRMTNTVSMVQDMGGKEVKDISEHVIISDPTGLSNAYIVILLALVVSAVFAVGIILIKRYVILRK